MERTNLEKKHHKLRRVVKNHWVQVVVGTILLISVFTSYLGLHHGILAMGAWHIAQSIPDILQALERISRWKVKQKCDSKQ